MTAFVIPEPILAQAWRTFTEAERTHGDLSVAFADALTAVAPLIVAEELTRLAHDAVRREGPGHVSDWLGRRAHQLDPANSVLRSLPPDDTTQIGRAHV